MNTLSTDKKRLEWLDALKGFVMLLVIWSHSKAYNATIGPWLTAAYMPVFFFASGYTMRTDVNYKDEVKKKSQRLLIPYVLYGVGLVSLDILFHVIRYGWCDRHTLCLKYGGLLYSRHMLRLQITSENNIFFLTSKNSTLWFLTAMFGASLLAMLYFGVKKGSFRILLLLFYVVISAAFVFCPILLPWSLDTIFISAVFMIAGAYFSKWSIGEKEKRIVGIICFFLYAFLVWVNPGINMSTRAYGPYGMLSCMLFLVIGMTGSATYMVLFEWIGKKCTMLSWIGKRTITFLCIQMLTIDIGERLAVMFTADKYIIGICSIICTLFFGSIWKIFLERYCSRIKIIRYL